VTKPDHLELAAHFIVALWAATRGRSGRFRRIDDCARRGGLSPADAGRRSDRREGGLVHVNEPRSKPATSRRRAIASAVNLPCL
jgi:hypothetical protein